MARTNSIKNYLSDVADAIRTRTGDSGPISASNFDTVIDSIPVRVIGEEKTVRYFDMSCNLLYEYTPDEFLALSANPTLPTLPSHLLNKGTYSWSINYNDTYVRDYVKKCRYLDIGPNFIPNEDLLVRVNSGYNSHTTTKIKLHGNNENGVSNVTVSWGDGASSSVSLSYESSEEVSHTYATSNYFNIEISGDNKYYIGLNPGTSSNAFSYYNTSSVNNYQITEVYIANSNLDMSNCGYLFNNAGANQFCYNHDSPTPSYLFGAASGYSNTYMYLKHFNLGENSFNGNRRLVIVTHPFITPINIGKNAFRYTNMISLFIASDTNASLSQYSYYCDLNVSGSLGKIILYSPSNNAQLTLASNSIYKSTGGLYTIGLRFPIINFSNSTTISNAGNNLELMDFRSAISVPTISSSPFSVGSSTKIVVPDSLYNSWITTTNWKQDRYKNITVKASEYID